MGNNYFIGKINIAVGFRASGGVIHNRPLDFDIFRQDGHYAAIPTCSEDDRRLANLPSVLEFNINAHGVESMRGIKDGNLTLIEDIAATLEKNGMIETKA